MLKQIFPKTLDNNYQGSKIAIIILAIITIIKLIMGINIGGINPYISTEQILTSVDNIPLNSYPLDASKMVIGMAQSWGQLMLIISLLSILILIKYRTAIPLMFLIYITENLERIINPIKRIFLGVNLSEIFTMAAIINLSLVGLLFVGLILSIYKPKSNNHKAFQ